MRKSLSTTFWVITVIATAVVCMAADGGVAEEQNRDRTGSPDGSNTCDQCHNSGSFNPFMELSVRDSEGNDVSEYVPGDTYSLRYRIFTLAGPQAAAFGFQSTILFNDLDNAGTFSDPGASTQLEDVMTASIPDRHIVEHSAPNPSGIFTVDWTAPENGEDVTFYYAGNAVNNTGGSGGDNSINGQLSLSAAAPDGLQDLVDRGLKLDMSKGGLRVDVDGLQGVDQVRVHDLSGREIYRRSEVRLPLDIESLPSHRLLLLSLWSEGEVAVEKVLMN